MYTAKIPLAKQVEAFEEAKSKDPSTWWPGDADLLVAAAPAPAPLPPGPPTVRASGFELGYVKKGTDGSNYRIVAGGGKVVGGKVLGAVQNVWERCPAAAATEQRKETGLAQGTRQSPPPSQPPSAAAPPTASSAAAPAVVEAGQRICGTPGCSLPDGHAALPDGRLHQGDEALNAKRPRISYASSGRPVGIALGGGGGESGGGGGGGGGGGTSGGKTLATGRGRHVSSGPVALAAAPAAGAAGAAIAAAGRSAAQERGMARLRLLPADDAHAVRVRGMLHASLPQAMDVVVYEVDHTPARRRYELALELDPELRGEVSRPLPPEAKILGIKELWHSTGEADPLDVLGSAHCLDPTYGQHGTYSDGGLCFAAHAAYCEHLRPCRSSLLAPPPDHTKGELPAVGEDVLLPCDANPDQVFEVARTNVDGDPALCELRPLPWDKQKGRKQPRFDRLGGGEGGTAPWALADKRFLLLLDVAAGVARDYGPEEPNLRGGEMPREPVGYHSVTGTEQDLSVTKVVRGKNLGIPQLVYREKCPEWRHDLAPLLRDGQKHGRQYAVWRSEQVSPPLHLLWPHLTVAVPTLAIPVLTMRTGQPALPREVRAHAAAGG